MQLKKDRGQLIVLSGPSGVGKMCIRDRLCTLGAASAKELCYFTGASMPTIKSLEKSGILTLEKQEVLRRVQLDDVEPASPPVLNEEQQAAFEEMCIRDRCGTGRRLCSWTGAPLAGGAGRNGNWAAGADCRLCPRVFVEPGHRQAAGAGVFHPAAAALRDCHVRLCTSRPAGAEMQRL